MQGTRSWCQLTSHSLPHSTSRFDKSAFVDRLPSFGFFGRLTGSHEVDTLGTAISAASS